MFTALHIRGGGGWSGRVVRRGRRGSGKEGFSDVEESH